MALAMQKSYDSFCSEWADFKAILVKRKDENGWTLAKVVSWSPNASITGYAKELRTLPLNWGIAVLKKEGFFRYASSMTNGQNFRCFPLKIKIGLCVSWILFFFWVVRFWESFCLPGTKSGPTTTNPWFAQEGLPNHVYVGRWTFIFRCRRGNTFAWKIRHFTWRWREPMSFCQRNSLMRRIPQMKPASEWRTVRLKPYRLQSLTTETYWNRGWYQCGRSQLQKTPQIIPKKAQTNNPIRSLSIMTPLHRRRSRKVKVHTFLHVNVIIGQKPRQGATA